jgi:hypothetical protein
MRHEETTRGVTRPFYYYIWNTKKKFDPSAVKHAMALCYVTTTLTRELYIIEFSNRFLLYVCKRHCVCLFDAIMTGDKRVDYKFSSPPPPHTHPVWISNCPRARFQQRKGARISKKLKARRRIHRRERERREKREWNCLCIRRVNVYTHRRDEEGEPWSVNGNWCGACHYIPLLRCYISVCSIRAYREKLIYIGQSRALAAARNAYIYTRLLFWRWWLHFII